MAHEARTSGSVPPLLVLTGPTGSGKSDWALRLAESAPVEIVSVDSALVYRGLDIGSAKPTLQVRQRIAHHLIDLCDPAESYSAGRFVADALAAIAAIEARRRVALLVGGTMLYLRALLHGLAPLPQASAALRAEINQRAAREGWQALHTELAGLDPVAAARIKCSDSQRIQRALEVCYATGCRMSDLQRATVSALSGRDVQLWALAPSDRAVLHARLEERFLGMMRAGFLEEVRTLFTRGDLTAQHSSMRAVGYRQLWAHLQGDYDLAEGVRRGISATRQLAKRQLTWLRSETSIQWLDPSAAQLQSSWTCDLSQRLRVLGF
ncbi:MAG: tRNA (adenosine(37)-N6)-dimethylallyltransferase MiaA [Sinobacteraceae bacterium]|nr:tRNA (adenosine(37)-N6)-dimethylallyltransferase MiaA [Nevskiaceae bacterium]